MARDAANKPLMVDQPHGSVALRDQVGPIGLTERQLVQHGLDKLETVIVGFGDGVDPIAIERRGVQVRRRRLNDNRASIPDDHVKSARGVVRTGHTDS